MNERKRALILDCIAPNQGGTLMGLYWQDKAREEVLDLV